MRALSLWKGDLVYIPRPPVSEMREVLERVAARRRVSVNDIIGKSKLRHIAWARQSAYWHIRHETGASYPRIGKLFGRNASTILFGVRQHTKRG